MSIGHGIAAWLIDVAASPVSCTASFSLGLMNYSTLPSIKDLVSGYEGQRRRSSYAIRKLLPVAFLVRA